MKKYILISAVLQILLSLTSYSQVPQAMNFQAVVRDAAGLPISNQQVTIKIVVVNDLVSSVEHYAEIHQITTALGGLFDIKIGLGQVISGSFNNIPWTLGQKFIRVECDYGQGWVVMGTQQLLAVPFAFVAGEVLSSQVSISSSVGLKVGIGNSTTWVCPSDVSKIKVELWGAGGGGARSQYNNCGNSISCFSNGGSGGYNASVVDVTSGQSYNVTIGQGGNTTQSSNYQVVGQNGGNTVFGENLVVAQGGAGGVAFAGPGANGAVINWSYPSAAVPAYIPSSFFPQPSLAAGASGYMSYSSGPALGWSTAVSGYCVITIVQ